MPGADAVPGGDPLRRARFGLDRTYVMRLAAGAGWRDAVAALAGVPGIEWAEPDPVGRGAATMPNDPRLPDQWGLSQEADNDIDAPEAWDLARGTAATVIAVLDTGVDFDHPDFAGKLLPGHDFVNGDADPRDDSGHGTSVASIAAARTDDGASVAGVCWDCAILPLKVLDGSIYGYYSWWADGLVYAADRGVPVINMSMGGTGGSTLLRDAIRYAADRGAVIVAAMMNDGDATPYYPAVYEETVAVGATNELDERALPFCTGGGSNYGPHIDVVAPGDNIIGARLGGGESYWCGTSQATAFVSGLAGLALSANAGMGREQSRHLLRSGAEDQAGGLEDTPGFDFLYGWGRLNAHRTLLAARSATSLDVSGAAGAPTRVRLAEKSPVATSYDMVRGDVSQLGESAAGGRAGRGQLHPGRRHRAGPAGPRGRRRAARGPGVLLPGAPQRRARRRRVRRLVAAPRPARCDGRLRALTSTRPRLAPFRRRPGCAVGRRPAPDATVRDSRRGTRTRPDGAPRRAPS